MENNENVIGLYEVVRDRYGKKHKVYSARFKDLHTITKFTEKYNPDCFNMYMLSPVIDVDGEVEMDKDGNINYDNGFHDDLMEIIELALDHREKREDIEEWLDLIVAKEIVMTYLGTSTFKKNKTLKQEKKPIGETLSHQ